MFKKIILLIVIISPLIFALFVGYPERNQAGRQDESRRCFKVGEFGQFIKCFKTSEQFTRGTKLISNLNQKTAALHPGFNVLLFAGLGLQIVMVILFLLF